MQYRPWTILAAVAGLLGCADNAGSPGWIRARATYADFQKDTDECRRAAALRPYASSTSAVGYGADIRRSYDDCMIARGWKYEEHLKDDRMKEMVDCKLPSIEPVQRMTAGGCNNRFGKILQP